jgi:hypothetical protein
MTLDFQTLTESEWALHDTDRTNFPTISAVRVTAADGQQYVLAIQVVHDMFDQGTVFELRPIGGDANELATISIDSRTGVAGVNAEGYRGFFESVAQSLGYGNDPNAIAEIEAMFASMMEAANTQYGLSSQPSYVATNGVLTALDATQGTEAQDLTIALAQSGQVVTAVLNLGSILSGGGVNSLGEALAIVQSHSQQFNEQEREEGRGV